MVLVFILGKNALIGTLCARVVVKIDTNGEYVEYLWLLNELHHPPIVPCRQPSSLLVLTVSRKQLLKFEYKGSCCRLFPTRTDRKHISPRRLFRNITEGLSPKKVV